VLLKVAGNGKVQLHLGATVQPSYLLNTDAYVLSDDYNTYIKDANAFRRWNLIAGAEAIFHMALEKCDGNGSAGQVPDFLHLYEQHSGSGEYAALRNPDRHFENYQVVFLPNVNFIG
jgi:hypothetical protein